MRIEAIADAKSMVEIIEMVPDIEDQPGAIGEVDLLRKEASVEFRNVTFSYKNSEEKILTETELLIKMMLVLKWLV